MGPAPPSRKENYATETCTTTEINTSVLEKAGPGLPGRMTCCGESRKKATMPMTRHSTRKTLNIGTWNVRTMHEAGQPLTRNTQTVIGHTNLCNKYGGPWTLAILALPDNLTFDLTHLIRMHIEGKI